MTQKTPTIRGKLTAILMAVAGAALLFATAASLVFRLSAAREAQARALSAHARIFAQGSAPMLQEGSGAALQPLLKALGADESIAAVAVYDSAGNVLAAHNKTSTQTTPLAAGSPGQKFESGRWRLFHPVTQDGRQAGMIYLESDPRELRSAQRRAMIQSALILAAGAAVAYVLSARLQRAVAGPVQELAGAARRAVEESNYAAALPKAGIEELSALSKGFNELLGQIRERDQAVHFTQAEMEQQVMARTTELSQANLRLREETDERRRAESTRETMAAIVENSRDLVCMASMEGAALFLNEAGKALLGLPLDGTPARLEELFHEEARKRWREAAMPAVQKEGSWEGETFLRDAAGRKVPAEASLFIVRDRTTAQPVCLAMTARGIQERLNLETRLRHAQKMDAIGQLAAGVAHDFNNVVTVVRGHAEMLLASDLPEEDKESLAEILSAAERGGNLTRQLLVFGRKQAIKTQPLNLNEVVAGLRRLLQSLLGDRIALQCAFCDTPALIDGDRTMIEQIMVNLALNARDAMPQGGALHVSTEVVELDSRHVLSHPQARAGRFCRITVKDSGAGMDPATLSRIFEPFFTTKLPGAGLGLSNVYGVAQQHRGWIEVESDPGAGATFRVHFPLAQADGASGAVLPPLARVEGGVESILIVEDDASLNRLLGSALQRLGYQLHSAPDGVAAWQMAESPALKLDLLIADMALPNGLTGCELALRLRETRPGLKVIITSGYAVDLKEAGAPEDFVFIPKPYEISAMARQARHCLDRA